MTTDVSKNWPEDRIDQLNNIIGAERPVGANAVQAAAEMLDVSIRSVASKLRKMGIEVASLAKSKTSTFSAEETVELNNFLANNSGTHTYSDIAEAVCGGKFTPKQIQGKVLALEATNHVKATEQIIAASKYSEAEEATFIALANEGAYLEEIAQATNHTLQSARGKALSLSTKGVISGIPPQKNSLAQVKVDPIESLGAGIASMTVAEIAAATERTERGIKTLLTRRAVKVADYDGAAKSAKARAKEAA